MTKNKNRLISPIISLIIGAVVNICAYILLDDILNSWKINPEIINSVRVFIILTIFGIVYAIVCFLSNGRIVAFMNLLFSAKLRGRWSNKQLNKLIIENFHKSELLKIKVTRGYNLFCSDKNENIYKAIHEAQKHHIEKLNIRLLLIYPCMQYNHNIERAQVHGFTSEEDYSNFINSWYEMIKEANRINHDNSVPVNIQIRFFHEHHSRWRFYIFKNSRTKMLLLSEYDGNSSGDQTPMYEVYHGSNTLCEYIDSYFDDIWRESKTIDSLKKDITCGTGCLMNKDCAFLNICKEFRKDLNSTR